MDIYVYLHHPGQFYDIDSKTKIYADKGKMLFIDLTYELSKDTLEDEGDIACNSTMDAGYDNCIDQQLKCGGLRRKLFSKLF